MLPPLSVPDTDPETALDDREAWLRLASSGLSARRLNPLLDRFGGPQALLEAASTELRRHGVSAASELRLREAAQFNAGPQLTLSERLAIRFVPRGSPEYPSLLAEIPDPPPVLFVRGDLGPTQERRVAIVGSRRADHYGRQVSFKLAEELAGAGYVVVSGLARGVDTQAHQGALNAKGRTIACLGCGVDVVYPAENRGLMERIAESGALVSEYPPGSPPEAWRFPSRNRIISGLSMGIVVVQAPERSGSLITVECALEQNREVFAVPGNVDNPRNRGALALIRDGAVLVRDTADILVELEPGPAQRTLPLDESLPAPVPELTEHERLLFEMLGAEPIAVDDLIIESGLTAAVCASALVMLELKGVSRRLPGNAYVRT